MELVTTDSSQNTVLTNRAQEISFPLNEKTKQFIAEFTDFFANLKSPFGKPAGLAAPQVGVPLRIAIIQIPPEAKMVRKDVYDEVPPTLLINPSYTPIFDEGQKKDWEGCFSVTGKMGEVYRHIAIQYETYTMDGSKIKNIARGFLARLLQHEIGHLNGELYVDILRNDCRYGSFDEMMPIRKKELEK